MKYKILFILFFWGLYHWAVAQCNNIGQEYEISNDESEFLFTDNSPQDQVYSYIISNGVELMNNNLVIEQIGALNHIEVRQNIKISSLYINTSIQLGSKNEGYINQSGNNHKSILFQNNQDLLSGCDAQLGNKANLWSEGKNTQNIVLQVGNSNMVNQFVENYYTTTRSVVSVQLGNNNEVNLAVQEGGEPNVLKGIMITQTGDANSAELVLNYSESSYLKVDQTGGAGIKISHTDFYLPMK